MLHNYVENNNRNILYKSLCEPSVKTAHIRHFYENQSKTNAEESMSAFTTDNGNVVLLGLTPEKVQALINAIEGASLPDKRILQHELKWLKEPATMRQHVSKIASKMYGQTSKMLSLPVTTE